MFKLSTDDRKVIELLATPSWLSGVITIVVALLISGGALLVFAINNDSLTQQLLSWQQDTPQPALTTPDQLVQTQKPTLGSSWPLLVLWSLAGLAVYAIAASVIHSIARAAEVRESLNYTNIKPKLLLTTTAEHLILRVIGSLLLVGFAVAFWKLIIPYSITAAHASAADILSIEGILYALLSFSVVVVNLHLITISLRLSLGTVRVFPAN
ncbi:MAG: hypothetical protein AAB462_02005 [Patescibacteria group bacterium]